MTYVAFTDHDTMAAYDEIGWTREGLVPAVEVKILDPKNVGHTVHINVYTLDRGQFREIRKIAGEARDIVMLIDVSQCRGSPLHLQPSLLARAGRDAQPPGRHRDRRPVPGPRIQHGPHRPYQCPGVPAGGSVSKGIVAATDTSRRRDRHGPSPWPAATRSRSSSTGSRHGNLHLCPADLTLPRLKEETSLRIRHLFDKTAWLYAKESLTIETGNAILDGIVSRVAQDRDRAHRGLSRWVLQEGHRDAIELGHPRLPLPPLPEQPRRPGRPAPGELGDSRLRRRATELLS